MRRPRGRREACPSRALLDQLEAPLTRFAFGFVHDRQAAEDVVQETYLRVIRNLHRFRGQASLKTWVYTIARNLSLDHVRAAGRSRLRLVESADLDGRRTVPDSLSPEPFREAERDERRAEVVRALARLSPQAKQLLVLRVYLGLGYREIARRCGVAPEGVGTRMARALRVLSRGLEMRETGG